MRVRIARKGILATLPFLFMACGGGTAAVRPDCLAGQTSLDGTCVSQQIADYVGCIRATGATVASDSGKSLSAEAGVAGVKASSQAEVKDKLERSYAKVSDTNARQIIKDCYSKTATGKGEPPEKEGDPTESPSPAPPPGPAPANPPSREAPPPADPKVAIVLFDVALKLMEQGRYAEACPKLAESHRIDPKLGALLYLADCQEKLGMLASAWANWRDGAELAQKAGDERQETARAHVAALEPKLAKLVLEVPATSDVPDLEIRRDGVVVSRAIWGTPIPIDVGDHNIEATAPGKSKLVAKVSVGRDGTVEKYRLAPLKDLQKDESGPAPAGPVATEKPSSEDPHAAAPPGSPVGDQAPAGEADTGSTQRMMGWVTGGLGVIALGAGIVFDRQRASKQDEREGICPSGKNCTAEQIRRIDALNEDVKAAAARENWSFISAGVLLGGSAALLLTAPKPSGRAARSWSVAPAIATKNVGLVAGGRW